MNYFENKKIKLYRHVNGKPDKYGNTTSDTKINYITDLMVDIQPATNKLLEKEFGFANEANYVLWVESAPNKNFILDKDTYVKFEYEDYKNLYQVVDRSRWIDGDEYFDDDYTSFSVKLVNNIEEVEMINQSIKGSINSPKLTGKLENKED